MPNVAPFPQPISAQDAQAPLVVWRPPSGWGAPEALAQHCEDQEGLEVGADLAVFSKDLCLRWEALEASSGWEASKMLGGEPWVSNNGPLNPGIPRSK